MTRLALYALVLATTITPGDTSSAPSYSFTRVRLIVTSTAAITDVRVEGASIASYVSSVLAGPAATRTSQLGQTMRLSSPSAGEPVEGQFDVILAFTPGAVRFTWSVTSIEPGSNKTLEVYDLGDFMRPRLVDRFTFDGSPVNLTSERGGFRGRVRVQPFAPALVIANFYSWYDRATWEDPQMLDRPVPRYSADVPADMVRVARTARDAGIDVLAVSWERGGGTAGEEDDRRMRIMLDAGGRVGIRLSIATETLVANGTNDPDKPTDPDVLLEWLERIVDDYGSHPAYLHVDGKPVIFVYWASLLTTSDWIALRARLRNSGRDPLLIGDFFHSTLLEPFDGEYQYINVGLSRDRLAENYQIESWRVHTYPLLRPNGRQRIWIASVSPGYDDTRLRGRDAPLRIDRRGGKTYDTMWEAAIASGADWVIVTSWNEWWENTAIEPGELYGTRYVDRTRLWASRFKRARIAGAAMGHP